LEQVVHQLSANCLRIQDALPGRFSDHLKEVGHTISDPIGKLHNRTADMSSFDDQRELKRNNEKDVGCNVSSEKAIN